MIDAAKKGDFVLVRDHIACDPAIVRKVFWWNSDVTRVTALHRAAGHGHEDICRLLVECGAEVEAKNSP
jgi:hypothetical protein